MKLPIIPAGFFSMVLGIIGLGGAWRVAHRLWGLPASIGETIIGVGILVWAVLALLYALKWIAAPGVARLESADPVQCCFIGLAGVSTMLVGVGLLPYYPSLAGTVFVIGAVFTLGFGVWRTGGTWRGGRDDAETTPILYLPLGAGSFVFSMGLSQFGYFDWAQLAFGAGLFTSLAIESVLLYRLFTAEPLAEALRPTLGIQLAPAAVGAAAYVGSTAAAGDVAAHALIGYALLQAVLLGRLLPWIVRGFSASLWAFSFGATALAATTETLAARGDTGAVSILAPLTFVLANALVAGLAVGTAVLLFAGRLLPAVPAPTPTAAE